MEFLKQTFKFELIPHSKINNIKWNNKKYWKREIIEPNNTAILTGEINNLIVLDVDKMKETDIKTGLTDGFKQIKEYEKKYGKINTLTIETPSGGIHYYFKYFHSNETINHLIKENIKTKTKYRNSTLDIRSNGGYIVAPPSKINDKCYKIINNIEPIEMPETLIYWLLLDIIKPKENVINNEEKQKAKQIKQTENLKTDKQTNLKYYNITLSEFEELINKLPDKYLNNFDEWLKILTITKGLLIQYPNIYEIFDKWSKKADKCFYNTEKNLIIWNSVKTYFDINLLIHIVNTELKLNLSLIDSYKPKSKFILNPQIKQQIINKPKLELDENIFNSYDTILINSTCGTGKTTVIAKQLKLLQNTNPNIKFISLTNLIKLSQQQLKTFIDAGLNVKNYQNIEKNEDVSELNIICCLNSIYNKLKSIDDDEMKNCILYIDEITSFIDTLLNNDMINKQLKKIYKLIVKLVKKAHKVIFTDATINNNVLTLIKFRNYEKTIYIKNEYKKFNGIIATKFNDENEFYDKISNEIKQNKYFLLGSDSKTQLDKIYIRMYELYPDKKDKFILINSKTNYDIIDANKQFKNKFVFFTPSITTGINFNIDIKQNVFIYIKGNTISPYLSFQQTCRTRNINEVYYFSSAKFKKSKYDNLEEVETNYKKFIETNEKINNLCLSNNDEDDEINENIFFKMFCFGELEKDIYSTNKLIHYETILKNEGFILKSIGNKNKLDKTLNKELDQKINELNEETFNKYIENVNKNNGFCLDNKLNWIDEKRQKLNIPVDKLEEYKEIMVNNYFLSSFKRWEMLFYKNECINYLLENVNNETMDIKNFKSYVNKIKLLREFEKITGLNPFQLEIKTDDKINLNIDNDIFLLIKKTFEIVKGTPKDNYELIKFYVGMIKNITGELDIIKSKNTKNKERKNIVVYNYNFEEINKYSKLFKPIKKYSNYDDNLLKIFNIKLESIEEDENKYSFGKLK